MPTFGNYETVKELYRTGLITAYSARLLSSREEPKFTVINYNLRFIISDTPNSVNSEIEILHNRIIAQKQIEKACDKTKYWAAVRDSGKTPTGAFYVTDLYPSTLKMLVDDNVKISAPALYRITDSIVQGLIQLQDFYVSQNLKPKSHGNLSLTNILITNKYTPENARVLLTEPCAYTEILPDTDHNNDYHRLGTIIYELVTLQNLLGKYPKWPVPDSKDWLRLGKNAHAWHDLCNNLLAPDSEKIFTDLQELKKSLLPLKITKRNKTTRNSLILVACIVLAAAGTIITYNQIYNIPQPKDNKDFNNQQWKTLCNDYYNWLGALLSIPQDKITNLEKDPKILAALNQLYKAKMPDPKDIAGRYDVECNYLALNPTEKAKDPANQKVLNDAWETLTNFKNALSIEKWPALKNLNELADLCKNNNWQKQYQYLQNLITNVNVNVDNYAGDLADAVIDVINTTDIANNIKQNWQSIQTNQNIIVNTKIPLFQQFPDLYKNIQSGGTNTEIPTSEDLEYINNLLTEINKLSSDMVNFINGPWNNNIDETRVRETEILWAAATEADLNTGLYETWMAKVNNNKYWKMDPHDDPRYPDKRELWDAAVTEIKDEQKRFKNLYGSDIKDPIPQDIIKLIDDVSLVSNMDCNLQNLSVVQSKTDSLTRDITNIKVKINNAFENERTLREKDYDEYVSSIKSKNTISQTNTPAINQAWIIQRDKILAKDYEYGILPGKINSLQDFLHQLESDNEMPADLDSALNKYLGNEAVANMPVPKTWNRKTIEDQLINKRKQIINSGLQHLQWSDDGLPNDNDSFKAQWNNLKTEYQNQTVGIYNTITNIARIETLLDNGYSLTETVNDTSIMPGNNISSSTSIQQIYTSITSDPEYPEIQNAFSAVIQRLQTLQNIAENNTDINTLKTYAQNQNINNNPEIILQAWRSLAQNNNWPNDSITLNEEIAIRQNIKNWSQYLENQNRKNTITDELNNTSTISWCNYVENSTDDNALKIALNPQTAQAFNLDTKNWESLTQLSDRSKYNLMLYQLKTQIQSNPPADNQITALVTSLLTQIDKYNNINKTNNDFISKLNELKNSADTSSNSNSTTTTIGADYSHMGPSNNGWQYDQNNSANDGSTITYNWQPPDNKTINHTLTFKRFTNNSDDNDTSNDENFYIATTEMPIGLFIDVISNSSTNAWSTLIDSVTLPYFIDNDVRTAPRSWIWNQQSNKMKITDDGDWLKPTTAFRKDMLYSPKTTVDKPSAMHPAQFITPQTAMYVTNLLGCRLPTQDEWLTVYRVTNNTNTIYNLRDQTWKQHQDYIKTINPLLSPFWPDSLVFIPNELANIITKDKQAEVSPNAQNDNILWFSKVNENSQANGIYHLIGNVAEYVFNSPQNSDSQNQNNPRQNPPPDINVIKTMLDKNENDLKIIGASALSAPQIIPNNPYPVDMYYAVDGYSDVGFRLAFSAPMESVAMKYQRLVSSQKYLTK